MQTVGDSSLISSPGTAVGGLEPLSHSQSQVSTNGADQSAALDSGTVTNTGVMMSLSHAVMPQQTIVTGDRLAASDKPVTRPAGQPATQRTVISAAQLRTMLRSGQRIVSMGTNARGKELFRVIPSSSSQSAVANKNVSASPSLRDKTVTSSYQSSPEAIMNTQYNKTESMGSVFSPHSAISALNWLSNLENGAKSQYS